MAIITLPYGCVTRDTPPFGLKELYFKIFILSVFYAQKTNQHIDLNFAENVCTQGIKIDTKVHYL